MQDSPGRVVNSFGSPTSDALNQGGSFQVKATVSNRIHKEVATQTLRSIAGSKPAVYLYTYRKLLGRIGAVFFVTGALAGIATIRNTPEVSVVTAVPTQTEVSQAAKAQAAVASEPITQRVTDPTFSTAPLIGDFGFSLGSPNQSIETPLSIKAKEPLTAPKPEETLTAPKPEALPSPSPAASAVAESNRPTPEPTTARKEFIEIAVQLTVNEGRVAEAQVANRQPGAEAFEATALHIARQRRYPPGTSRTETVVVRVANQLGEKQP